MYSVLKSYGLNGLNGFAVAVEADVSGGLPAFSLVGLPDSAVRESGDRVRSAVKNLGYKWPDRHITVNLAPADIRKSGPVYDLPLLLAVLASSGQMEEPPATRLFWGSWHWMAACARFRACCPWRWRRQQTASAACMCPPKMPPKPPRRAATRCRSIPPAQPGRSWMRCRGLCAPFPCRPHPL